MCSLDVALIFPLPHRKAKRTLENTYAADIKLTKEELNSIWEIVKSYEVKGDRYYGDAMPMHLWG